MAEIDRLVIDIDVNTVEAERSIDRLLSKLASLKDITASATGQSNILENFRQIADEASSTGGKLRGLSQELGALSKTGNVLKSLAGGISKIGGAMIALPKFFGGQLIGRINTATQGIVGFFSQIKRVATFRLIRTALRLITEGFSEGIKNLYAWSSAINGKFAASMDRLATASMYLKNSIAAMVSPLIEAVAPAIDFIVDKFVAMFNTVNQLFARLAGQTTYTAAKKVATKWDDASKSASKTAKALKRTILSFDEINQLSKDTSSGGGSGSAADSGAGMFETRKIDSPIGSFADRLKKAFTTGDWKSLGKIIGGKLNEAVSSVDWAGIGRKVGEWINGWFTTKYWTLDTISFTGIGSKIAEFLNNAMAKINFGIIGRTLVQKLTMVWDMVIGFFTKLDWGMAARKIGDFVKGTYKELTRWFKSYDWGSIGNVLYKKLNDALTNFDFAGIAKSFLTMLGFAVRGLVSAGAGFIAGFWNDVSEYWNKNIKGETFTETVHNMLDAIGYGLGELPVWVWDNIVKPFGDALVGEGGLEGVWESLKETAGTIWGDIKRTILTVVNSVSLWVSSRWINLTHTITNLWKTLQKTVSTVWNAIAGVATSTVSTIKNTVTDKITVMVTTATAVIELLKRNAIEKFEIIKSNITTIVENLKRGATEKFENIKNFISTSVENLKQSVTDKWNTIKITLFGVWEVLRSNATEKWTSIKNTLSTLWENIQTNCMNTFGAVKQTVKDAWDGAKTALRNFGSWLGGTFANTWENAWKKIVNGFGTVFSGIKDKVKGPINAVIGFMNKMLEKIEGAINTIIGGINSHLKIHLDPIYVFGKKIWDGFDWGPSLRTVSWGRIKELAMGGILDKPTLFGALGNTALMGGEAGREAVLPLENHTEWMDDVARRVVSYSNRNEGSYIPSLGNTDGGGGSNATDSLYNMLLEAIRTALEENNTLAREGNNYLRQINEKEFSAEITTSSVNRAMQRTNRRAGTTIVPVG